jgi:prolyl oligopeptidase
MRGGAEYGESWHRAGMLEKKQNVFDDFIAVAEQLIKDSYTSPSKLESAAARTAAFSWSGPGAAP